MDPTIVAAIIGGLFSILAVIATFIITRIFDSDFWPTRNVRQAALDGHWDAILHQEVGPGGTSMDLSCDFAFKSKGRGIQAEAILRGPLPNETITMDGIATGRFVYERYLKLEYQIKGQPGVLQFGYLLLELSPNALSLDGHFLGFGAYTQQIIWGAIHIKKRGGGIKNK